MQLISLGYHRLENFMIIINKYFIIGRKKKGKLTEVSNDPSFLKGINVFYSTKKNCPYKDRPFCHSNKKEDNCLSGKCNILGSDILIFYDLFIYEFIFPFMFS